MTTTWHYYAKYLYYRPWAMLITVIKYKCHKRGNRFQKLYDCCCCGSIMMTSLTINNLWIQASTLWNEMIGLW